MSKWTGWHLEEFCESALVRRRGGAFTPGGLGAPNPGLPGQGVGRAQHGAPCWHVCSAPQPLQDCVFLSGFMIH